MSFTLFTFWDRVSLNLKHWLARLAQQQASSMYSCNVSNAEVPDMCYSTWPLPDCWESTSISPRLHSKLLPSEPSLQHQPQTLDPPASTSKCQDYRHACSCWYLCIVALLTSPKFLFWSAICFLQSPPRDTSSFCSPLPLWSSWIPALIANYLNCF